MAIKAEKKRQQALKRLEKEWLQFSPPAQAIYRKARDLYERRSKDMREALIQRVMESEALIPEWKEATAVRIREEFERTMEEHGNPKIGPYFPLQRFGRFYLFARRYQTNEKQTFYTKKGGGYNGHSAPLRQ